MTSAQNKMTSAAKRAVPIALIALWFLDSSCATTRSPREVSGSGTIPAFTRLADGKQWTTENLNLSIEKSYCYGDSEPNCLRYGRLYTWESAQRACQSLRNGWRLPTNEDWYQLAKQYGGIRDESVDTGRTAYNVLANGGRAGFNALLGGGRAATGPEYTRLEAHGFYWTASETGPATAWFYNFGRGQQSLGRHHDGEKQRAFSVRCVRY